MAEKDFEVLLAVTCVGRPGGVSCDEPGRIKKGSRLNKNAASQTNKFFDVVVFFIIVLYFSSQPSERES